MKIVFHIIYKLRGYFLEYRARRKISKLKDGEYRLQYQIPYVSQYASAERAEEFVKDEESLKTDARWRESGAETLSEYVFWAPKLCGIACFKMISGALSNPIAKLDLPLIILGKKAMAADCYLPDPKNSKRLIGMLHKPFLKFAKNFLARRSLSEGGGFEGKLIWYIGPNLIASEILKSNFVIASVHHDIRNSGARPKDKTGHLVLVHGFEVSGGKIRGFYIHNPSGFYNESQENHFVPVEDFIHCFSGRVISLRKK